MDYRSPPGSLYYNAVLRHERLLRTPEYRALMEEIARDREAMEDLLTTPVKTITVIPQIRPADRNIADLAA